MNPRQPRHWQPPSNIEPNATVGVTTRARKALNFELQQKADADVNIWEVLQNYQAPESLQTCDSMDTINLSFWDHVLEDPNWRSVTSLCNTEIEQSVTPKSNAEVGLLNASTHSGRWKWNVERAGWAILISNWFLSESSFHTGDTPTWTFGIVVASTSITHPTSL